MAADYHQFFHGGFSSISACNFLPVTTLRPTVVKINGFFGKGEASSRHRNFRIATAPRPNGWEFFARGRADQRSGGWARQNRRVRRWQIGSRWRQDWVGTSPPAL